MHTAMQNFSMLIAMFQSWDFNVLLPVTLSLNRKLYRNNGFTLVPGKQLHQCKSEVRKQDWKCEIPVLHDILLKLLFYNKHSLIFNVI